LATIFGARSLHPKIPFPAAGLEREVQGQYSGFCTAVVRDLEPALQLFRIESERLKLPAPFSRRIAEPFDADATGQATFYCCFDKVGCEKGERDGHIDLPNAAVLARTKFCDRGYAT
jgi:hypothetical protein